MGGVGRGIYLFWFIHFLFTQLCLLYAKHSDGCRRQRVRLLVSVFRFTHKGPPLSLAALPPPSLPLFPSYGSQDVSSPWGFFLWSSSFLLRAFLHSLNSNVSKSLIAQKSLKSYPQSKTLSWATELIWATTGQLFVPGCPTVSQYNPENTSLTFHHSPPAPALPLLTTLSLWLQCLCEQKHSFKIKSMVCLTLPMPWPSTANQWSVSTDSTATLCPTDVSWFSFPASTLAESLLDC